MTISDQPIRVLHIISRLNTGGVERRTLELIESTWDDGIQHHICLTSGLAGTLDNDYKRHGAILHYLSIKSIQFWWRFPRLLKDNSIDVVHSNILYMSGPILLLAWISRVPKRIAHFRTDGPAQKGSKFYRLRNKLLKLLIKQFATNIIGLTPENLTRAWSKNWRKDQKCEVISNGVSPRTGSKDFPSELAIHSNATIVLHAGRANIPTKNREKAITVFASYLKFNQNAILVFVGRDGNDAKHAEDQLSAWKKLAESLTLHDQILFLGDKSSVDPYYSAADVLLFTSTREGLPGVVLEALASGLPVVSSNVPGSEFIAETNPNITILDAEMSDGEWASQLSLLDHKLSIDDRMQNIEEFKKTPFTLNSAIARYTNLWKS